MDKQSFIASKGFVEIVVVAVISLAGFCYGYEYK
jgi:hypothetical protein